LVARLPSTSSETVPQVLLSGLQYGMDPYLNSDFTMSLQARPVFENVRRCLAAAGCTFRHVIKMNSFPATFDDFDAYNEVYCEYFTPPYPVRSTVQVGVYGFFVEVEALARPEGRLMPLDSGAGVKQEATT
jgi:enamine deaminase RidA (YjgF/YER057c/UK114 family)